jgi:hypothetical protein
VARWPSDEKDWLALTEVMKQDLRGHIFCGEHWMIKLPGKY